MPKATGQWLQSQGRRTCKQDCVSTPRSVNHESAVLRILTSHTALLALKPLGLDPGMYREFRRLLQGVRLVVKLQLAWPDFVVATPAQSGGAQLCLGGAVPPPGQ